MERLRQMARGLAKLAAEIELRDSFVFGGLACAVYGVSGFSVPAAWIMVGVVLFGLGVRGKAK